MATLQELIDNVVKIRGFIAVYLGVPKLNARQQVALQTDLKQLDKNLAALAAYTPPVAAPVPAAAVVAEAPPNFGPSDVMSSALYGEWVAAWWLKNFGGLDSVDHPVIAKQATADGCLAQVCAVGKLGTPDGPVPALGDWSLYTALTTTNTDDGRLVHNVYHMGKLVGTQEGGDGLDFAHSLGFNW